MYTLHNILRQTCASLSLLGNFTLSTFYSTHRLYWLVFLSIWHKFNWENWPMDRQWGVFLSDEPTVSCTTIKLAHLLHNFHLSLSVWVTPLQKGQRTTQEAWFSSHQIGHQEIRPALFTHFLWGLNVNQDWETFLGKYLPMTDKTLKNVFLCLSSRSVYILCL